MTEDPQPWLTALHHSQDQLAKLAARLDGADIRRRSYCTDWDVAQVYSHLGSQAEMFSRLVQAGVAGEPGPGRDAWGPLWDEWNGRTPDQQVAESVARNEGLLERLEGLSAAERERFRVHAFGRDLDLLGVLQSRLNEHVLHTWDVAVAFDQSAELLPEAVPLLITRLAELAARTGKPAAGGMALRVVATAPASQFLLNTAGVSLQPWSPQETAGTLQLPAAALIRLVAGRLDSQHTPPLQLQAPGLGLDDLRAVFPGL